ncbi:hypothetical protein [Lactobacillus sp. B4026]|uniref:hypothetical protein n=1 Tax=Lactobacillus sp. B4026 TaxID=2818035 RepID=UPI00226B26A6|nr:hypothetical protein [Lactobacillus sp. B4026]MCX8737345.1 hypothetical protein [Lactobacillus sp. B4026]
MNDDYIKMALKDDGNLKVILKGCVENVAQEKVGVVSESTLLRIPKRLSRSSLNIMLIKKKGITTWFIVAH